jgi:hypothetical protein
MGNASRFTGDSAKRNENARSTGSMVREDTHSVKNVNHVTFHEQRVCALDLMVNLRTCDPDSHVLINNATGDPTFTSFAKDFDAAVFPCSDKQTWGRTSVRLLNILRFAVKELDCDTLTCVDSDQLATRPGWSERLASAFNPGVSLFGRTSAVLGPACGIAPVRQALTERALWLPFMRHYPGSEAEFVHWSFGPGMVFCAPAVRELIEVYDSDLALRTILERSQVVGMEEVFFPTVLAMLGYRIAEAPHDQTFLLWQHEHSEENVAAALARPDVFWIHPIKRDMADPRRRQIAAALGYQSGAGADSLAVLHSPHET